MSEWNGLPEGWVLTSLGELGEYLNGRAFNKTEWSEEGRPIIRIQDLTGTGGSPNYYAGKDLEERYRVRPGDLLVSWSATLGAYIWTGPEGWLNQHIFKVASYVDKRFHYFLLQAVLSELYRQAHGSGMVHITKGKFEATQVALPPLAEQRRIKAAIEEQLSRLNVGVAALERVQVNLKRYRTAVLKAAVEGRLTEAWREENPDVDPASELLERVLKERRERWKRDQRVVYEKKGKKPPKNWRLRYKEPAGPNTEELPELPEEWCWASVDQILVQPMINGISVKGSDDPPGVPALRLSAMSDRGFDYSDHRYIPIDEKMAESLAIREGDFFVSRGNGSLHLVGRGTLAQDPPVRIVFPDTMIRLRTNDLPNLRSYISIAWASRVLRMQIEKAARTTAGIYKISQRDIGSFAMPLPPLTEQKEIAAEVERRLSILQEVEAEVEANLKRASRLRQSILKHAFEGKLVPQDPSDERASELLERIRQEREQALSKKLKRRTKKKATANVNPAGHAGTLF